MRSIIEGARTNLIHPASSKSSECPFGQVGQPIWVKETYTPMHEGVTTRDGIAYRADYLDDPHGPDGELSREGKYRFWKPSSSMPKWASRLVLHPTRIRLMALSAIVQEDGLGHDLISPELQIPPTGSLFDAERTLNDMMVWAVDFTKELLKS